MGRSEYDLALTGMAVQALAGASGPPSTVGRGEKPAGDDRGQEAAPTREPLVRGAAWLAQNLPSQLDAVDTWHFYNLAIGAAGLAAALERKEDPAVRDALARVIERIKISQNADGGWGSPQTGHESDSSGTGWCLDALAAARRAKIDVPDTAFERARSWFEGVTGPDGRVGYRQRGDGGFLFRGLEERVVRHEILAPTCRASMPRAWWPRAPDGIAKLWKLLEADVPSPRADSADYLYWYQGARALAADPEPAGVAGRRWLQGMRRALLRKQARGAGKCRDGSWEPDDRWGGYGGRVYATALNALTLARAAPALAALGADRSAAPDAAERARLQGLVHAMGSTMFREREEATRALVEAGDVAEPFVREALGSEDEEVRSRARMILERLGLEVEAK